MSKYSALAYAITVARTRCSELLFSQHTRLTCSSEMHDTSKDRWVAPG